jgi:predicted dienelactone hydrolase
MHHVALIRLLVWAALLSTILPTADTARATTANELELVIAGLDVAVWPPEGGPGPYPLVLFSHGLGGCKTQSTYLMRGLAEHGMLVVAPDHKDKGEYCPARVPTPAEIEKGLLGPHEYRMEDLQKLRDALPTETKLSGWRIDPDRVALVGHSLGGFTVLALAASWPNSKKDEIAAVVALAPYAGPLLTDGAVDSIPVPVLLQRGGGEFSLLAEDQKNLFPKLPAPACEVVYPKADHFAWTDVQPDFQDATAAATIAFLDEAFAGRPPTEAMLASSQTDPPDCKP